MTNQIPQNIIFDFGGVLLDIDIKRTIKALQNLEIALPNPADIHPNNAGIFLQSEIGAISATEFIETLGSYSNHSPKPTTLQVQDAWCELLLPFTWERFEMLDKLREKGHKVFLLSNTNEPHHLFFEAKFDAENPWKRTFQSFFNKVYYSDVLRMRKPDVEIYEKVAQLAGLDKPEDILFIDDNAPNLVAPAALGWQTYHLTAPEDILDMMKRCGI